MQAPLSSVVTLVLCNCLVISAQAQQAPAVPAEKTVKPASPANPANNNSPQTVEIQARSETQLAQQSAAAKTVVTNAELVKFGDNNIFDAMRRVPGVQVNNNKIQLLGMNAAYTQVLIDGEPPRGVNVEDIPMQMIERIEIYRTANAQFSTQAMAGTVNIILKRAATTNQQSIKLTASHAQREAGSVEWNKTGKDGNLSHNIAVTASLNSFGMNVPAVSTTDQYLSAPNDNNPQLYRVRTEKRLTDRDLRISPRFSYKTEDNINLTSTTMFAYNNMEADSSKNYSLLSGPGVDYPRSLFHDTQERANLNSTVRATASLPSEIKLDVSGGFHANRMKNGQTSNNYDEQNKLSLVRSYDTSVRVLGMHTSGKASIPGSAEHDIVLGWTGSRTTVNINRDQTDFYNGSTTPVFLPQNARNELTRAALYAQDEWKFQKNSSIYLGLRWETLRIKSEGSAQDSSNYASNILSPIVQTLWQLNPENTDRIRVGLAKTYQAPNDFYLVSPKIYSLNNSLQNPNFIGNPSLRPELAWALDSAFEHNGKDGWNYAIRTKLQQVDDLHRDIVYFENKAWWKKYINLGSAKSASLELSTQFPLKRFIADAPDLDVNMSYMHFWSTVKSLPEPYNQLNPYTYQFTLGLNYRAKGLPLTLGMNAKLQDSHWQQTSLTEREYVKTPRTLDLYGLWKFDKQRQLRLAINNLSNSTSSDSANFNSVAGYVSQSTTAADRRRQINLSYEHKF